VFVRHRRVVAEDVSLLLHAALPGANSENPARYLTRGLVNSLFKTHAHTYCTRQRGLQERRHVYSTHTHTHAHILYPAARPARATTHASPTHSPRRALSWQPSESARHPQALPADHCLSGRAAVEILQSHFATKLTLEPTFEICCPTHMYNIYTHVHYIQI